MRRIILGLLAALLLAPAQAQTVRQTGTVGVGHAPYWAAPGVIGDAGDAQNSKLTTLGVVNNGGPGICINSAPVASGNYNQLCLSAGTTTGGSLSLTNVGTATGNLSFTLNGATQSFPTVTLPVTNNAATCFSGTSGTIKQCPGLLNLPGLSSGVVSVQVQAAAGTFNFNLPTTAGTAGQVLASQGGGSTAMTWVNATGSPGGSTTQVQFNNAGSFSGSANLIWVSPTLTIGAASSATGILALSGTTSGTVSIKPQDAAGTYNFNLPTTAGTAGQVLTSQGGGSSAMTWASAGTGAPGGSNTQVQFNNSSAFGGSANMTWVSPKLTLGLAGTISGQLALAGITSGSTTIQPQSVASGTLSLPATTDTLVGKATTDQFTNKSFLTSYGVAGSGSGTVTVQVQAAAGTYNWNLPITAGSAGQPLLSQGGGGTAMTWGTISGNTTKFSVVSGNFTSGNCIAADVNLNLVDAGAPCAGGAGGSPPGGASTTLQYNNGGVFGGLTSSIVTVSGTLLTIAANGATDIPVIIKGFAAQSGDLQRWTSSVPATLAKIDSTGRLTTPNVTVTSLSTAGVVTNNASGVLSSSVSLATATGGTGQTAYADGQLLIGQTSGSTLNKTTLTAGSGITITNGSGTITVALTAGANLTGPGVTARGTAPIWNGTAGGTVVNGNGACNIRGFGAVDDGTDTTVALQLAITTCGFIYIPSPAGGQTYDAQGIPTKCYVVSALLTWPGSKGGGAVGDGPGVSCINSTSATACVMQPQDTFGLTFANFTVRHATTTGAGFNTRASGTTGCGIDAGLSFKNDKMLIFNVHAMYNSRGFILGATQESNAINLLAQYNSGDAIYWGTNLNAATLAASFYGLQWNIVNYTAFFNNGRALYAQCVTGDIPLQAVYGMRTSLNGGATVPIGTNNGALFYTIEVDGETNSCAVEDFALYNSFLGEGGRGEIWIHTKGTTPNIISNVSLESPGNCVVGQGIGIAAFNNAITGNTNATAPLIVNGVIEFGCGNVTVDGIYLSGPSFWSITDSSFQNNASNGIVLGFNAAGGILLGPGSLKGTFSLGNTGFGVAVNANVSALTSIGNTFVGNGTNISDSLAAGQRSNTGDWCGAALTAVAACVW